MAPPRCIDAPYNFVPLSEHVLEPEWGALVSQDLPFSDGLSGTIAFAITAHSPILVGGEQKKRKGAVGRKHFFTLPDGRFAIPGSSLRGMIRNVLEIASFGAMRRVDDQWLAVRDLTAAARPFYGERIVATIGRTPSPEDGEERPVVQPLSRAGWLSFDANRGAWRLEPCEYARVEFDELVGFASGAGSTIDWLDNASSARWRYEKWERAGLPLRVTMKVGPLQNRWSQRARIRICMREAKFGSPGVDGTLVFTGFPERSRKHREFFFFNSGTAVDVPHKAMNAFLTVHEESEDWHFWKRKIARGERVPVFWLERKGVPWRIGLAMMFRLAHEETVHQLLHRASERHIQDPVLDLPTLLFGHAADDDTSAGSRGLKGRAWFDFAVVAPARIEQKDGKVRFEPVEPKGTEETVLSVPKPSYYPNYVRQPTDDGIRLRGNVYATYTPLAGNRLEKEVREPRIRGWKRYPARPRNDVQVPAPPEGVSEDVKVQLHPLPKGTRFQGRLRFHNLRPVELGALLWALTWGGDTNRRHGLGMGKPFGFGQVTIELGDHEFLPNDPGRETRTIADYIEDFTGYMDGWCRKTLGSSWRDTEQMRHLLAMADPDERPAAGSLDYMRLPDFQQAKRNRLVLAPYVASDEDPSPGTASHTASNPQTTGDTALGIALREAGLAERSANTGDRRNEGEAAPNATRRRKDRRRKRRR